MTGITVAIRTSDKEDTASFRFRDLTRLQSVLLHPGFVEGSARYLEAYAEETSVYRGNGLRAPEDAGLIAIDLPSLRILSYEGFLSSVGRCSAWEIAKARDGIGAHRSRWENRAAWEALMVEGRVSLRVRWDRGLDDEETTETFWRRLTKDGVVPAAYEEHGPYPRQPFSIEPLRDLDAAAARIAELERMRPTELRASVDDVLVDLAPWTVTHFPFTRDGAEALRVEMAGLGFPGCEIETPGWKRWSREVGGQLGTEPYLANLRAHAAEAIEVGVPA